MVTGLAILFNLEKCSVCKENVNTCVYNDSQISQGSLQLLLDTPDVLCECFLQAGFLHTSQHCFTLLADPLAFSYTLPVGLPRLFADGTFSRFTTCNGL